MLKPGDLLFTKPRLKSLHQRLRRKAWVEIPQGEAFGHIAIFAGGGQVIESQLGRGVITVPIDEYFKKNEVKVFRVQGGDGEKAAKIAKRFVGKGYDMKQAIRAWLAPRKRPDDKSDVKIKKQLPKSMNKLFCSTVIVGAYPNIALSSSKHPFDILPVDIMRSPLTTEVPNAIPKKYREVDP